MHNWSVQKARETYNIAEWGEGYFDVNEQGHLIVYPQGKNSELQVDLVDVAARCKQRNLNLPILVRFNAILQQRVVELNKAFTNAMQEFSYQAEYQPVYPIKVNQQKRVVEELLSTPEVAVGLEAGSKPELLAVLGLLNKESSTIICNGYKDREYICLALIAKQLGHQVYIVIEKSAELALVLQQAQEMKVEPLLGIRVRLSSTGKGQWQNSGGEKSKFGLTATQVLSIVEQLKKAGKQHCLQLLHFHLGSQVANIRDIQKGLHEAGRYYVQLRQLDLPISTIDVGGGLAVDYEGTQTRSFCSMNYSLQQYANNIVQIIAELCKKENCPYPNIITESGRAMVAHHAVLLTNVIDAECIDEGRDELSIASDKKSEPMLIQELWHIYESVTPRLALESYHDAKHWLGEAQSMYIHGLLSLQHRAHAEQLYTGICLRVREMLTARHRAHRELLDQLNDKLADKLFCNFSVFQSAPDIWAINQIFPIMPLQGLEAKPTRRAKLQDITCDSDGRIDNYVDGQGIENSLPLPAYQDSGENLVGLFLLGAYQEILGDMHNLFGDPDSVHVEINSQGGYELVDAVAGDSVSDVLAYVHFDAKQLLGSYQQQLQQSSLSVDVQTEYLEQLEKGLQGYTYFEDDRS